MFDRLPDGTKYSRMDQIKFVLKQMMSLQVFLPQILVGSFFHSLKVTYTESGKILVKSPWRLGFVFFEWTGPMTWITKVALHKSCPYSELFWSIFTDSDWMRRFTLNLRIQWKYRKIRTKKSPNRDTSFRSVTVQRYFLIPFGTYKSHFPNVEKFPIYCPLKQDRTCVNKQRLARKYDSILQRI